MDTFMGTRDSIIANVKGLVADFLYYDRIEDEELERGDIEEAISEGVIDVSEIVAIFEKELREALQNVI